MFLVSSCSCLCPIHWSQVLSWEWRCSWSSADRRCSNYIWVINNFIADLRATYIRDFTVYDLSLSYQWSLIRLPASGQMTLFKMVDSTSRNTATFFNLIDWSAVLNKHWGLFLQDLDIYIYIYIYKITHNWELWLKHYQLWNVLLYIRFKTTPSQYLQACDIWL